MRHESPIQKIERGSESSIKNGAIRRKRDRKVIKTL
tara:strand:+ start:753 stop:860 length:108 start_codon:yes stop_codon:yes gene_type:complete